MKRTHGFLLLLFILLGSAGFTFGLTYAPCFSSLCSEEFFPDATRVHIASFYALVASIACALLLRIASPWWHSISNYHVTKHEVPILDKRISLGGLALAMWIVGITVATTAFWVEPESNFWEIRTIPLEWDDAQARLMVTGIVGHHCDIVLGLVLIPVSRNSILGRVFALHQHTLLYAHKLLAYTLFLAAIAHGGAYYAFVGTYGAAKNTSPRKDAFNIDNPTLTIQQSEARGSYYYTTLPTGMLSFLLLLVMIVTSLPWLRRRHYNTFYYCHVICSIIIFVLTSIHASTDFYFLLPGLLLWALDWGWRLFRGTTGLQKSVQGTLEDAGHGWYRICLPASAKSIGEKDDSSQAEKQMVQHPIQSYHLNIPSISKTQNHAFTAATIGSSEGGPTFLLQRAQIGGKKPKTLAKEWTWKLGDATSQERSRRDDDLGTVEVRVEGPYIPSDTNAFEHVDHIICIVGGTGFTGAYSLALWWLENQARIHHAQFSFIWTVRYRETANVREWQELVEEVSKQAQCKMRMRLHVSSEDGRINALNALREELASMPPSQEGKGERPEAKKAWVYVPGPAGLLSAAEDACTEVEREGKKLRKSKDPTLAVDEVSHYVARWEV